MKHLALVTILVCGVAIAGHATQNPPAVSTLTLMPMPASVQVAPGRVAIDTSFSYAITGAVDERLTAGVNRAVRRLEGRTGMTLPRAPIADAAAATLVIHADNPGQKLPSLDEDESYDVSAAGTQLTLTARTVVGALRGSRRAAARVRRPRRLFHSRGRRSRIARAFTWRGLLIDAGRHFEPVDGDQARARRDGRRQAQRAALASERGPGLPRREPQVPEAPAARIGRPVLHAGPAARRRRVRARCAAFASCPSSTCPAT